MFFLNPLDFLEIRSAEITSADLKKARKKRIAEIELANDAFSYLGLVINRSEAEAAFLELENPVRFRFYQTLLQYPELNIFLTNGTETVFQNRNWSSLKEDSEFLQQISPYFSFRFRESLLKAFRNKNIEAWKKLTSVQPLVLPSDFEACYQAVIVHFESVLSDIQNEYRKLVNQQKETNSLERQEWVSKVKSECQPVFLNGLPPYFQPIRNQLAYSIMNLGIVYFNQSKDVQSALRLLKIAKNLETDLEVTEKINYNIGVISQHASANQLEEERNGCSGYGVFLILCVILGFMWGYLKESGSRPAFEYQPIKGLSLNDSIYQKELTKNIIDVQDYDYKTQKKKIDSLYKALQNNSVLQKNQTYKPDTNALEIIEQATDTNNQQ